MDPVSAFVFAAVVATVWVSDWTKDFRDALSGNGLPRHERRMQRRAQEHELRRLRLEQRHAERLAGVGPTIAEAIASRIRNPGPRKTRDDFGPLRGWWFDLAEDTARRLTEERRARYERAAAGEGEARRIWEWTRRQAEAWKARNKNRRDRHSDRDGGPSERWESERTDRKPGSPGGDSNAPGTCPGCGNATREFGLCFDCETSRGRDRPDPFPDRHSDRSGRELPELEPSRVGGDRMPCPDCQGAGCVTCGHDGQVPTWLADPGVTGAAARHWGRSTDSENPPGTTPTATGRIPEPPEVTPVDQSNIDQGATMTQPALAAQGVSLAEAGADMTAANATLFADAAAAFIRRADLAFEEAITDLEVNKKVNGPAINYFRQAQADMESALRNITAGGRVTADHATKADEYRDYQTATGSGDVKTYAEL